MKTTSIKTTLLAFCILASPLLTFAGQQPRILAPAHADTRDLTSVTRAVKQGKGTGLTRRSNTSPDASSAASTASNRGDSAFHK
jgi:hypothetical protein